MPILPRRPIPLGLAAAAAPSRRAVAPTAELIKYWAVARVTVASQTAYLGEILARTIFLFLVLYVFLQLWTATYAALGRDRVAGFSVPQMLWYLMVTEAVMLSRPRISREIDAEVRAGDIAYQLIRPYDYVLFRVAAYLGERALRLGITLLVGLALVLLLVGPVPISPAGLAAAGLVLLLGALVDCLGALAIGLGAFWVEDTSPIVLLYDRAVMLLGGMLLPLELFPEQVAAVLAVLPFQLLLYAPARLVVTGDLATLPDALARLLIVLLLAALLVRLIFARAVRRLHANGG